MNPLDPQPMSPAEIADLVSRVRTSTAKAFARGHVHHLATTRGRCAARYARLVNCSLREAAETFGLHKTGAHDAWRELYPHVHTKPRWR